MFAVDWTESLLYDLVIDTDTLGVMTAIGRIVGAGLCVGAGGQVRLTGVVGSPTVFRRRTR